MIWYVILSFSPIIFLYLFYSLFLIFSWIFIILSYHYLSFVMLFIFIPSFLSQSFIIFFLFLLYHFFVFYVSLFYSLFLFYVHPFSFVLASKRNNYTDSEMNTLIVVHLVPLITRDQQWCACSAYPIFNVARSANSASSCYAIAICSEPMFTKNVKSYRYLCVCQKKK